MDPSCKAALEPTTPNGHTQFTGDSGLLLIENCRLRSDRSVDTVDRALSSNPDPDKNSVPPSPEPATISCQFGEITVVLGRNQSGKTDLSRLIAGLPSAASGDITIDGASIDRKNSPVAMVFQAFVNYPNWNVAQNIGSPLIAKGRLDKERVRQLAELVKIDHLLERMPHELSGGQQQRLAIARALAKDPSVLVMDEPFVNIDFKLREALNTELRSLVDETGVALLFMTSDPSDALSLADQLILLERHLVIQQGSPLDLYQHPNSLVAANLLSDPSVNQISSTLYVRPEHIGVTRLNGTYDATVRAVETNGAESYFHVDVALGDRSDEWVVKTPGMTLLEPGAEIQLAVDQRDLLELAH